MALQFTTSHIEDSIEVFRHYKRLGERAMAQLSDKQLFAVLDSEANSIAIIRQAHAGNMRSRWTDFLITDGEKPTRNRDSEFVDPPSTREALLGEWEHGWATMFDALEPLTDADLARTITIRGEAHSVMQAINRQLAHYSYHVGQVCAAGQALRQRSLAISERSAQPIGGVQSPSRCGRSEPAIARSSPAESTTGQASSGPSQFRQSNDMRLTTPA